MDSPRCQIDYRKKKVLERLNLYFDQVVPAITDAGGEILKFMGDAVLAYFNHEHGAAASCAVAFDAARLALARLAAVSNAYFDLSAGVALHHGKVSLRQYWLRQSARLYHHRWRREIS